MAKPQTLEAIREREAPNTLEDVDLSEKGRSATGEVISSNRRLFMQFMAFGDCSDTRRLITALQAERVQGVLYEDVNDPRGVGLVTFSETPDYFVDELR
ncbi:hypothetical protein RY27_28880, partial [Litorilinea aerophila]